MLRTGKTKVNMRIKAIATALILLASLFVWQPPGALANSNSISVIRIRQPIGSEWCWAASAVMAGRAVHPASQITQRDVVSRIKGTTSLTASGTLIDSMNGSRFVTNNTRVFSFIGIHTVNGVWTFAQIRREIDRGRPVQACWGVYNSIAVRQYGHMVVIFGYDAIRNEVLFNDPWCGTARRMSYTSFLNRAENGGRARYDGTVFIVA